MIILYLSFIRFLSLSYSFFYPLLILLRSHPSSGNSRFLALGAMFFIKETYFFKDIYQLSFIDCIVLDKPIFYVMLYEHPLGYSHIIIYSTNCANGTQEGLYQGYYTAIHTTLCMHIYVGVCIYEIFRQCQLTRYWWPNIRYFFVLSFDAKFPTGAFFYNWSLFISY